MIMDRETAQFYAKKVYNSDSWKDYLKQAKSYRADQRYALRSSFTINGVLYPMSLRLHDNKKDIVVTASRRTYIFKPSELENKTKAKAKEPEKSSPKKSTSTKKTKTTKTTKK